MDTNFGASAPYTVGVEEELQLLDSESFALTPAIDGVLEARDAARLPEDSVTSELSASCVEIRSPVYATVADLADALPGLRRQLRGLVENSGARLAAAGAHPFSVPTEQEITNKERYRMVDAEMGWPARMQAIYGLHVHVAVASEEQALRAVSALSRYVPLFIALSANSPFWAGADTRLASVRTKVFGLVPRSGLPPPFRTWEDFERYIDILVAAGSIPDYTLCWWDARPHPRLGTVELRAPDSQTESWRIAALAALAQCLVATSEEHDPEDPLLIEENKWRATRHGIDASFYDFSAGHDARARDVASDLVDRLRPVSQDLECEAQLEAVLNISNGQTGAERQREVFAKRNSLKDVARRLVADTA